MAFYDVQVSPSVAAVAAGLTDGIFRLLDPLTGRTVLWDPASPVSLDLRGQDNLNNYLRLMSSDGLTRLGYLGYPNSTHLRLRNDVATASIYLDADNAVVLWTGGAETARFTATDLLVGKTVAGSTTGVGNEIRGGGYIVQIVSDGSHLWQQHQGAADTNGQVYTTYRRTTAGTTLGSVTQVNTTGVAYNATSDARLKDAEEVDDERLDALLDQLHPVFIRWKLDADGNPSPDGTPSGRRQASLLAQELFGVIPEAVTPGNDLEPGTPAEHTMVKASSIATRQEIEVGVETREGFRPWQADFAKIVPYLVASRSVMRRRIAEQNQQINDLQQQIHELVARVDDLARA